MTPDETSIIVAEPAHEVLLSNLLELYIHDLSAIFPHVRLGDDGRFGYPSLPLYWSEPERRFAFILRHGEQTAGFALVTRGLRPSEHAGVYDVAELFVLRRHRRSGVGRAAVLALWSRLPGRWMVRVADANPAALAFWSSVIAERAVGSVQRSTRLDRGQPWQVFELEVGAGPDDAHAAG